MTAAVNNRRTNIMRTIRTKVYKFDELSKEAQNAAINSNYDINVFFDWWQDTYNDAENIGLKITSFDLDRNRKADGNFLLSANEVAANIFREHGEHCETYKTALDFIELWQPIFNNYMDENHENYESAESESKLIEIEGYFLKSLLEDYSITLQNESEYLQGEEAIKETLIANEYEFLQTGKRF